MEAWKMLLKLMYRKWRRFGKLMRRHKAVTETVCMAVVMLVCAAGVSGGSRSLIFSQVKAAASISAGPGEVQAAEEVETEELQAGLMGVVNSAITMKKYSEAAREVDVSGSREEILVGAARASRTERRRSIMEKAAQPAGELLTYAKQVVKSNQMPENEYYTLLQIVEAEATGEDVEGKMLIANVILNRVADDRFPDTIEGVVWQQIDGSAQFQPTVDGRIYSVEITDATIEAVDRVLAGEDASQGALFFMARNGSEEGSIGWFEDNLVLLFKHGGHEYYTLKKEGS